MSRWEDEQRIRQVVVRYCRGTDRADWDLVRSCYHDDAIEDHLGWRGSPKEFVAFGQSNPGGYVAMSHCVMNQLIEWRDDTHAASETYAIATHRTGGPAPVDETIMVRYLDLFELRDQEWRIAQRKVVSDWSRVDAVVETYNFRPGSESGMGTRDRQDPSYALFGRPPLPE